MLDTIARTLDDEYLRLQDKAGRPFSVGLFRGDPAQSQALRRMYASFEPKECAQGLPPRSEPHQNDWLDSLLGSRLNLFALRGAQILGHAVLLDMAPGESGEYLVFVHQAHQDRGIGSALTRATRAAAQILGYGQLWLTVELLNTRAIRVYERAGFRRIGPPETECEMVVNLLGSLRRS